MNLQRTLGVICLTLLCGLICGTSATADVAAEEGISMDQVKSFTGYTTYYAGPEVAGLPLENINGDATYCCSFMYGTCNPPCSPPLEIQVFSTCERWFRGIAGRRHTRLRDFRGAKTMIDPPPEMDTTPEIFTGRTTVAIHGRKSGRTSRLPCGDS